MSPQEKLTHLEMSKSSSSGSNSSTCLGVKWRVSFEKISEVQDAFDGDTSAYRLFDTVEEAQKAVDTFKFDAIIWHYNPELEDECPSYEGVIDGYGFTITRTDSFRYHREDCDTWQVTECDCKDFLNWLTDRDDVFNDVRGILTDYPAAGAEERDEDFSSSWSDADSAKVAVVKLWGEYQVFCDEHKSYDAYMNKVIDAGETRRIMAKGSKRNGVEHPLPNKLFTEAQIAEMNKNYKPQPEPELRPTKTNSLFPPDDPIHERFAQVEERRKVLAQEKPAPTRTRPLLDPSQVQGGH